MLWNPAGYHEHAGPPEGVAVPEASPLDLPLPLVAVASSSSYKACSLMYRMTALGMRYSMLISLRRNILILVELISARNVNTLL